MQKKTMIILLMLLIIIFFVYLTLTFSSSGKQNDYSLDPFVQLHELSPNGKYFVTSEKLDSNNVYRFKVIKTKDYKKVSTFDIQADNLGEIDWLSGSKRFLYSDLETPLVLFDIEKDNAIELPVKGYPPHISPNEKYVAVGLDNKIQVINLETHELTKTYSFSENFKPNLVIDWYKDGIPKYIVGSSDLGETFVKVKPEKGYETLNTKAEKDSFMRFDSVGNKFGLLSQEKFIFHNKNSGSISYLNLETGEIRQITDQYLSLTSISPNGIHIGTFDNGIKVFNLNGELVYENNMGESEVLMWEWLDQDSFVIVYRELLASGFLGETNRIEIHNISERKRVNRIKIPKIRFDNVYLARNSREIFLQTEDGDLEVFQLPIK